MVDRRRSSFTVRLDLIDNDELATTDDLPLGAGVRRRWVIVILVETAIAASGGGIAFTGFDVLVRAGSGSLLFLLGIGLLTYCNRSLCADPRRRVDGLRPAAAGESYHSTQRIVRVRVHRLHDLSRDRGAGGVGPSSMHLP